MHRWKWIARECRVALVGDALELNLERVGDDGWRGMFATMGVTRADACKRRPGRVSRRHAAKFRVRRCEMSPGVTSVRGLRALEHAVER